MPIPGCKYTEQENTRTNDIPRDRLDVECVILAVPCRECRCGNKTKCASAEEGTKSVSQALTDDDDNSLYDGNQPNILKLLYGAANIHHEHCWKDSVIYSTSMMQNGLTQSCWTAVMLDADGRLGSRKRESSRDMRKLIYFLNELTSACVRRACHWPLLSRNQRFSLNLGKLGMVLGTFDSHKL